MDSSKVTVQKAATQKKGHIPTRLCLGKLKKMPVVQVAKVKEWNITIKFSKNIYIILLEY